MDNYTLKVSEKLVGTRINRVVYLPFVCVTIRFTLCCLDLMPQLPEYRSQTPGPACHCEESLKVIPITLYFSFLFEIPSQLATLCPLG